MHRRVTGRLPEGYRKVTGAYGRVTGVYRRVTGVCTRVPKEIPTYGRDLRVY